MTAVPLCIDLDGTLIRTDLLHESLLALVRQDPRALLSLPYRLFGGRAAFKHAIADRVTIDATALPYNKAVLALIDQARTDGRPVVLATAAAPQLADAVAAHLGGFDAVISSGANANLSGVAKAARLSEQFGSGGFDYVGNAAADIPVWKAARQGFVVGGNSALDKHANRIEPTSAVFGPFFNSLRPVQWLKNLLIFVPLLAGHKIGDANLLFAAVCAFVAFCLTASAVYIVNDLLDLDADRHHHRKAARPFASGAVPVAAGVIAAPILLIGGIVLGTMFLPPAFIAVLGGYLLLTSLYSFWLKRLVIVDVIVLAGLYTLRIFAGSAATGIAPSFWLLAFSQFIFFSLAIVKRYTELLTKGDSASIVAGRGYYADDLPVLMALGASSGLMAVLVMALYIDSTATTTLYAGRAWLWFIPPPILYWVARLWMKTHRGEVHDDPVIFAARDPVSLIVAAMLMLIFVAAANDWEFW
jgi:4-hydroxybenzoate polyprenyltransferase/phosphoserine phosphatase